MSLHNLAQHLQTAGRGEDKMLVHMTPKEVGGLQALAMAHGGALTINPETGLPEAGFLSAILPTLAGAALTIGSGGVINPMTAGLIIGGAGTAMTGDLGKGLMMGLGAYGGAGFGAGLSAAGTGASFVDDVAMAGGAQSASAAQAAGQTMPNKLIAEQALQEAGKTPFSTAFKGLQSLGTEAGRGAFMSGTSAVAPYATPASLGSTAMNQYYDKLEEMAKLGGSAKSKSLIRPYELERDYSSEPDAYGRYFRDKYTALEPYRAPGPEYRAAGGLLAFNGGGMPVEQMSRQNAIGANTRYPMASQTTSTYATPAERPVSENIINPPGYEAFDPYTGAQRFAIGGDTSSSSSTPAKPKITRWDKAKKIIDIEDLQDVYERMGGVGNVPEAIATKFTGNKRSEEELVKQLNKEPYFSTKGIPLEPRINSVAQATLGRDATPEEIAKLKKSNMSVADLNNWFTKNAKDEFTSNLQKTYDTRQEITKAYQSEFGRAPELMELKKYQEEGLTGDKLKQTLRQENPENMASVSEISSAFRARYGRVPTPEELGTMQKYQLPADQLRQKALDPTDPFFSVLEKERALTGKTPKFTTDAAGQQQLAGALSAPKSATERLGLGQFYGDMDTALRNQMATAGQGMRFAAPAAQTQRSALDQYYAPTGTNIAQGSAEQAQLSSLLAAQNVAKQAALYGLGPTVARPGSPGMFAPRFTSSGNIYSAGFYSPHYGSATPPATPVGAPSMGLPPAPQQPQVSFAMAQGGIADLGGYSDGGRLLKGPGDGVSDSIPASIGGRRPARLADGEFVIPARIVSELGNGSTEAGARQLYAMMERVQKRRGKTTGKNKVAVDSGARKLLPA